MKRKIQHDAVNNQEDEDSSAYPIYSLVDETSKKKIRKKAENTIAHFPNEGPGNNIRSSRKKYR